jgi:hypothetical protein
MAVTQARMQQRYDTAANWASVNPVLLPGEFGFESDTLKFKLGDGATAWNSLTYIEVNPSSIEVNGDVDFNGVSPVDGRSLVFNNGEWTLGPILGPRDLSTDDYYSNVTTLVRANGLGGGTTVLDESSYAKALTVLGSGVITSTTDKKFGTASLYKPTNAFDAYVAGTVDNHYNLTGNIDFTIECWFKANTVTSQVLASYQDRTDNLVYRGWRFMLRSDNRLQFIYGRANFSGAAANATTTLISDSIELYSANTWHHYALTRQARDTDGVWRFFLDGRLAGTTVNDQLVNPHFSSNYPFVFFKRSAPTTSTSDTYAGYIDDFRITKGVCRYTTTFTPPIQEAAVTSTTAPRIIYTIDGLDDVDVSSITPTDNQGLFWDNANQKWLPADYTTRQLTSSTPPTLATDTGTPGDVRYDSSYVYVCTAANTWVRAALSSW